MSTSEVLTAVTLIHVDKNRIWCTCFRLWAKDLNFARIRRGICRTKEPGTGDMCSGCSPFATHESEFVAFKILETMKHITAKVAEPIDLVRYVHEAESRVPVVEFCGEWCSDTSGCCAHDTVGCWRCLCWFRYFPSGDPKKACGSQNVTTFDRPDILAQVSEDLGEAMICINKS